VNLHFSVRTLDKFIEFYIIISQCYDTVYMKVHRSQLETDTGIDTDERVNARMEENIVAFDFMVKSQ
jgi:hypothetical protein